MHICDPQLNDARLRRRDRFWRWVCRDLNNRHECWLGPCPSIGHFAVVACYRGVHLPPPREQQAAVDPILPRHLGDIGSLRETLGKDPSLLLRRPTPPAPTTADQLDPTVALPIMLVLMPIMKQRIIPLFTKQGAQSTVRRTSARWGPHAAIDCRALPFRRMTMPRHIGSRENGHTPWLPACRTWTDRAGSGAWPAQRAQLLRPAHLSKLSTSH